MLPVMNRLFQDKGRYGDDQITTVKLKLKEDIESKCVKTLPANEETSFDEVTAIRIRDASLKSHHGLQSSHAGESEVEHLASRIDSMYANRIPVTSQVKLRFLLSCLEIAIRDQLKGKIKYDDLVVLRDSVRREERSQWSTFVIQLGTWLGIPDDQADYLGLLESGMERCQEIQAAYFYFQDFAFYNVRVRSRWPWRRNITLNAFMYLFLFYFFTPILFCVILDDKSVCPSDPTGENRPHYGWLTSLYFASITMSSVGYGDVTIDKSTRWRILIGILYILTALLVAILALSAAASAGLSPLSQLFSKLADRLTCNMRHQKGGLLHRRIYRTWCIIIAEVVVQFMLLNLLGVFVLRAVLTGSQLKHQSWMLSFYWSVQTTTTIGYGDVELPWDFRWFQIFYLTLSTYFVGSALGRLGNLKHELEELRLYYAWERREVSKAMIDDMKARSHEDRLDQYEFVVASLLSMRKISPSDVGRIMDKYRILAGPSGYIELSHVEERAEEKAELTPTYEQEAWEECDRLQ